MYQIPEPRVTERGAGGPKSILAAVEMIRSARNPVILGKSLDLTSPRRSLISASLCKPLLTTLPLLAGGGVTMAQAEAEVAELASLLAAPVAVTYLHNDAMPADNPLYAGPLGKHSVTLSQRLCVITIVTLSHCHTVTPHLSHLICHRESVTLVTLVTTLTPYRLPRLSDSNAQHPRC